MKKTCLLLLFLALFASCKYRILINGKLDHTEWELKSKLKGIADSLIVIGKDDSIPTGAILVNTTKLASPFFWMERNAGFNIILKHIKYQANHVGANIIKVNDIRVSKFTRLRVYMNMYSLKEPFLSKYKRKMNPDKQIDGVSLLGKKYENNFMLGSWELMSATIPARFLANRITCDEVYTFYGDGSFQSNGNCYRPNEKGNQYGYWNISKNNNLFIFRNDSVRNGSAVDLLPGEMQFIIKKITDSAMVLYSDTMQDQWLQTQYIGEYTFKKTSVLPYHELSSFNQNFSQNSDLETTATGTPRITPIYQLFLHGNEQRSENYSAMEISRKKDSTVIGYCLNNNFEKIIGERDILPFLRKDKKLHSLLLKCKINGIVSRVFGVTGLLSAFALADAGGESGEVVAISGGTMVGSVSMLIICMKIHKSEITKAIKRYNQDSGFGETEYKLFQPKYIYK